jgi:uncharacterized membrane protein YqgA involved in biofilm formation
MLLSGTIVNIVAIITGGTIGMLLNNKLDKKYVLIFFQVIGLFTLFLGISMALKTTHVLHMVLSLILGALAGELLGLEKGMEGFTVFIKQKLNISGDKFSEGIITAFLLYCMGSMTILGGIEEGMTGNAHLLYIKSLMDGVSSIALASALGAGVIFSVIPLLIFQGGITLASAWLGDFFPHLMINELSAVGGILLMGLGLQILEIKKFKIINMLPSLVVIIILLWLFPEINF